MSTTTRKMTLGANRQTELLERIRLGHQRVEEAGQAIAELERSRLDAAVDTGDALLEMKASLGHGKWMPWVKQHLPGITHRSIGRYCRLAEHRGILDRASNMAEALEMIDVGLRIEKLRASAEQHRLQAEAHSRLAEEHSARGDVPAVTVDDHFVGIRHSFDAATEATRAHLEACLAHDDSRRVVAEALMLAQSAARRRGTPLTLSPDQESVIAWHRSGEPSESTIQVQRELAWATGEAEWPDDEEEPE